MARVQMHTQHTAGGEGEEKRQMEEIGRSGFILHLLLVCLRGDMSCHIGHAHQSRPGAKGPVDDRGQAWVSGPAKRRKANKKCLWRPRLFVCVRVWVCMCAKHMRPYGHDAHTTQQNTWHVQGQLLTTTTESPSFSYQNLLCYIFTVARLRRTRTLRERESEHTDLSYKTKVSRLLAHGVRLPSRSFAFFL